MHGKYVYITLPPCLSQQSECRCHREQQIPDSVNHPSGKDRAACCFFCHPSEKPVISVIMSAFSSVVTRKNIAPCRRPNTSPYGRLPVAKPKRLISLLARKPRKRISSESPVWMIPKRKAEGNALHPIPA